MGYYCNICGDVDDANVIGEIWCGVCMSNVYRVDASKAGIGGVGDRSEMLNSDKVIGDKVMNVADGVSDVNGVNDVEDVDDVVKEADLVEDVNGSSGESDLSIGLPYYYEDTVREELERSIEETKKEAVKEDKQSALSSVIGYAKQRGWRVNDKAGGEEYISSLPIKYINEKRRKGSLVLLDKGIPIVGKHIIGINVRKHKRRKAK